MKKKKSPYKIMYKNIKNVREIVGVYFKCRYLNHNIVLGIDSSFSFNRDLNYQRHGVLDSITICGRKFISTTHLYIYKKILTLNNIHVFHSST